MANKYVYTQDDLGGRWGYITHPLYASIRIAGYFITLPVDIKDGDSVTINGIHNIFLPPFEVPQFVGQKYKTGIISPELEWQGGVNVPKYTKPDDASETVEMSSEISGTTYSFKYQWIYNSKAANRVFYIVRYNGGQTTSSDTCTLSITNTPIFMDKNNHWIGFKWPDPWLISETSVSTALPNLASSADDTHTGNISINDGTLEDIFYKASVNEQTAVVYDLGTLPNPQDPLDPHGKDDDSGDDGGNGDHNHDSDDDDIPDLPTTGVTDSGLVTLFAPTNKQLKDLAAFLWSDQFSLQSFKKLFNDPMQCILGLSLLPVNLPHGASREITVGNIVSTVSCDVCESQYVSIKCGSISVKPKSYTNSYLDYSPYTKTAIYLPFIGTQPLDTDEIMGSTVTLEYHVDVLTGAMCAYLQVAHTDKPNSGVHHVLYTYMGQCCESVPLSSQSWGDSIGSILNAAAQIGGVVATAATGGAAAPVAAAQLVGATTATANATQSMKPTVNHSGSLGGGGGMMAQRTPKLIFEMPNISKPSSQQNYTGYPTNRTLALSECSGFTQVQSVNLKISGDGVGATDTELEEIERLLKEGVYV